MRPSSFLFPPSSFLLPRSSLLLPSSFLLSLLLSPTPSFSFQRSLSFMILKNPNFHDSIHVHLFLREVTSILHTCFFFVYGSRTNLEVLCVVLGQWLDVTLLLMCHFFENPKLSIAVCVFLWKETPDSVQGYFFENPEILSVFVFLWLITPIMYTCFFLCAGQEPTWRRCVVIGWMSLFRSRNNIIIFFENPNFLSMYVSSWLIAFFFGERVKSHHPPYGRLLFYKLLFFDPKISLSINLYFFSVINHSNSNVFFFLCDLGKTEALRVVGSMVSFSISIPLPVLYMPPLLF
jgi:hypothetical protein